MLLPPFEVRGGKFGRWRVVIVVYGQVVSGTFVNGIENLSQIQRNIRVWFAEGDGDSWEWLLEI